MKHINLHVEGSEPPGTQPVEVEECPDGAFRVLHSPGFVEGIAAGDLTRVTDWDKGFFEIVNRGGNVSIKWATRGEISSYLDNAIGLFADIDGRFDGASGHAAVWTVPAASGFPRIEECMEQVTALAEDSVWWYGNVYDKNDRPLNWWLDE